MWDTVLDRMLDRLVQRGTLRLQRADGSIQVHGDGGAPDVTVQINDPKLAHKILLNAELALGEAYMDRRLEIADDDLHGFLTLVMQNATQGHLAWWQQAARTARRALRRWVQHNPLGVARRNVEHHYDLSVEFYRLFLDDDLQYTCAYFADPADTLETAQARKKAHIAQKLLIEPDMKVMDIGCGWGGMALTLGRDYGARVVGVTLSQVQLDHARARAHAMGLADRVEFRLSDYRDVEETFDRIVVVGMLEHVGVPQYGSFFRQLRRNLTPDGVALVHTIGRSAPPGALSPWFNKYIFPGGYSPAMSEVMHSVQNASLFTTDVEVWRLHYARTLQHWQARFDASIDRVRALYDDRFCRMWRYYLVASELSFSLLGMVVFQFQLSRSQSAVPLTRDYTCAGTVTRPVFADLDRISGQMRKNA